MLIPYIHIYIHIYTSESSEFLKYIHASSIYSYIFICHSILKKGVVKQQTETATSLRLSEAKLCEQDSAFNILPFIYIYIYMYMCIYMYNMYMYILPFIHCLLIAYWLSMPYD